MPRMAGKFALLDILQQHSVTRIFGNPGTTELPLMEALAADERIQYVLALQEAAVIAMADGYARASGGLAVASVHAAPGLGNAMGMLYNASRSGTPLLVIAGQQAQGFGITEPTLAADLPPIARPFVKWSSEVARAQDLPVMLHRAIKVALSPPTGPVFLSLPVDVLEAETDIELTAPTRVPAHIRGDLRAVRQAAERLGRSERPMIIAGDAVAQGDAQAELVHIAEMLGAPVYLEGEASTNAFPTRHPLFRAPIVRLGPSIRKLLSEHDVLFSVGGDLFTLSLPSEVGLIPPGLDIIHLDIDPWQLGKNHFTHTAILGDPKATLPDIAEILDATMNAGQKARARARAAAARALISSEREHLVDQARAAEMRSPISPIALNYALGELLPANAIVIDESISSGAGLRQFLSFDAASSFHGLRGGGIGWGAPAAIGAKLAHPDRPVVALIGDGSAMYTCQALWTAAHSRAPVTFIIINNRSYRILKQRLNAQHGRAAQTGRFIGMELTDPDIDFVGLARSMGLTATGVATIADFRKAMQSSLDGDFPTLIEVAAEADFQSV
jgi:benzoylformate decarboxylase